MTGSYYIGARSIVNYCKVVPGIRENSALPSDITSKISTKWDNF